jgi:hypothetical protein
MFSIEDSRHCELHVALTTAEEYIAKQHVRKRGSLACV